MRVPWIAITAGDPAGIGPEVLLKALAKPAVRQSARIVVLGDPRVFAWYARRLSLRAPFVPVANMEQAQRVPRTKIPLLTRESGLSFSRFQPGKMSAAAGKAAVATLLEGAQLAFEKKVDALVTGPVNKSALHAAGYRVEGQTELLGRVFGITRYEMMLHAGKLRVLLLSRHLSLRRAISLVSRTRILDRLRLGHEGLQTLGFSRPRIAVAGLNPHASEGGIFGSEEAREILPAIRAARREGIAASGPYSPDTIFRRAAAGEFDLVLALYHDQAFIPVKTLGFDRALTTILGLPFLRVSVIHGTAFEIAGRGVADSTNMEEAIVQAACLAKGKAPRGRVRQ